MSTRPLVALPVLAAAMAVVMFAVMFALTLSPSLVSAAPAGAAGKNGRDIEGVVNINTAPPATLSMLSGIGPAKVHSIVQYRQRRPFRTVDELVRIKGISGKMVRRLRPYLAVNGPTTAQLIPARAVPPIAAAATPAKPAVVPARRPVVVAPTVTKVFRAGRDAESRSRANLCLPRR